MPSAGVNAGDKMRTRGYIGLALVAICFLLYVSLTRTRSYEDIAYDYGDDVSKSEQDKLLRFSDAAFSSDYIFHGIENVLRTDDGQAQARKLGVIILVQVNSANKTKMWVIDTKSQPATVSITKTPKALPDCHVEVSDDDCVKMLQGKLNIQSAFLTGQLKVYGNVLRAARLQDLLIMAIRDMRNKKVAALKKVADVDGEQKKNVDGAAEKDENMEDDVDQNQI